MDTARKREREKQLVTEMISLYCRRRHHTAGGELCPECQALAEYARSRSEHCPYMENKTFCSNCRTHCYSPRMREQIRQVMRFSGPRMLFHHPGAAIWHLVSSLREKGRLAREGGEKTV